MPNDADSHPTDAANEPKAIRISIIGVMSETLGKHGKPPCRSSRRGSPWAM